MYKNALFILLSPLCIGSELQIKMTLGVPCAAMATLVDDGWIYLFGGIITAAGQETGDVLKINVIESNCKQLAEMDEERPSFACVISTTKW